MQNAVGCLFNAFSTCLLHACTLLSLKVPDSRSLLFACFCATQEATENKEAYFLRVELPGFDAEDISIQMANGNLTVSANRQEEGSKDKPVRHSLMHQRPFACI